MEFLETAWKGFRNLKPRRQKWRSGLNVLLGPNGSGKTNLLEALSVLCGWGAFPGNKTSSLVAWNSLDNQVLVTGSAGGEREIEVEARLVLTARGVQTSLRAANEKATYADLRSLLPSLSFLPTDIDLLDGAPSVRRLFLDKLCALCSPLYARRLAEYRQLVRQRTVLLRKRSSVRVTTVPLVQLGGWIWESRRKTVDLLAEALKQNNVLLPFETEIALVRRGFPLSSASQNSSATQELAAALEASLERERASGQVLVGPHRDDLLFSCLGRPAASALSRGQKRRTVMAAILASGRVVESKLRHAPILLLDDVAAELDTEGRELAGRALLETGWQVFVTGTENPFPSIPHTLFLLRQGDFE